MVDWLFPAHHQCWVLIRGLDASGKTTLLYRYITFEYNNAQAVQIIFLPRLKLGTTVTTIPTIGFNVETVRHKGIKFTFWDLGGGDKIKPLWKHYYQNTGAIIFVVDSTDRERFSEVRQELREILEEKELALAHLLVLGNKADLEGALSPGELWDDLGLADLALERYKRSNGDGGSGQTTVLPICATSGQGCTEALDWLANVTRSSM